MEKRGPELSPNLESCDDWIITDGGRLWGASTIHVVELNQAKIELRLWITHLRHSPSQGLR
jgi:hypothetical protein